MRTLGAFDSRTNAPYNYPLADGQRRACREFTFLGTTRYHAHGRAAPKFFFSDSTTQRLMVLAPHHLFRGWKTFDRIWGVQD